MSFSLWKPGGFVTTDSYEYSGNVAERMQYKRFYVLMLGSQAINFGKKVFSEFVDVISSSKFVPPPFYGNC